MLGVAVAIGCCHGCGCGLLRYKLRDPPGSGAYDEDPMQGVVMFIALADTPLEAGPTEFQTRSHIWCPTDTRQRGVIDGYNNPVGFCPHVLDAYGK